MPRMMWIARRYYLQEVKRRSSVMRLRPVNPNLPDIHLVQVYHELIGKECDELFDLIDPQFKQLARIEQLNETLVADDQPDNEPVEDSELSEDSELAEDSDPTNAYEPANDSGRYAETAAMGSDMFTFVQFPYEIVNEVTIDSTVEVNAVPSSRIMVMQSQEEIDLTFEILQEIIIREIEEDEKRKAKKEREEQQREEQEREDQEMEEEESEDQEMEEEQSEEQEMEEESEEQESEEEKINNYEPLYYVEDNVPGFMILQIEASAQEILDHLMHQEFVDPESMEHETIEQGSPEQDIIQVDPMEQDLMQPAEIQQELYEAVQIEEPTNKVIILEQPTNNIQQQSMNEVLMINESINEVILIEQPMNQVVIIENKEVVMEEPAPNPIPNPTLHPFPSPTLIPVSKPTPNPVPNAISNPVPKPTSNPVPKPTSNPVPKRANRRKQKLVIKEQANNSKEVEVIRDGVSKTILLDVRPAGWPKTRPLKTYERKRKQSGPMADTRPDNQSGDKTTK